MCPFRNKIICSTTDVMRQFIHVCTKIMSFDWLKKIVARALFTTVFEKYLRFIGYYGDSDIRGMKTSFPVLFLHNMKY